MELGGLVVPTPTLFGPGGNLDAGLNGEFCRGLAVAGVPHIFALGTLGEFPYLSFEERGDLVRGVARALPPGTDLWVGCGAPSTAEAVRNAQQAAGLGARALVVLPPYFMHPAEAAIGRYYRAVRAAVDLPLLAYNIPGHVGYALRPGFVHELAREGILQGAKDTSGTLGSLRSFVDGAPEGFAVLPGDDDLATGAIHHGATGAVMGTANILPKLGVATVRAALDGDRVRAQELQGIVDRLQTVTRAGPFPSTDKFLCQELRGARVGYRSPGDPLTSEEEARARAALKLHGARFREFL
jgi:4-hydroxy-tetrahydrodipicolinate synthase